MGALISATEVGWRGLCEVFLLEGEPVEMEIQKPSHSLLRRRRSERARRKKEDWGGEVVSSVRVVIVPGLVQSTCQPNYVKPKVKASSW